MFMYIYIIVLSSFVPRTSVDTYSYSCSRELEVNLQRYDVHTFAYNIIWIDVCVYDVKFIQVNSFLVTPGDKFGV